jgi:hypothetical protein
MYVVQWKKYIKKEEKKEREEEKMKIVVNDCYGGFGLSEKAVRKYCELKGINYDKEWNKDSSVYGIKRTDPILIQVVKELGEEANDFCSGLKIEEIPNGSYYRIIEYDG